MRRRGFTVVEALLTSFLFLLLLGVAALFMRDYARLLRADTRKSNLRQAQAGLDRITGEVRQAVQWVTPVPGSGGSSAVLEFVRVNPNVGQLPAALPTPLPATWQPWPSAALMTTRYQVVEGRLVRTLQVPGQPDETLVLQSDATGFACRFLPSGNLQVEVSVALDAVVHTLQAEVQCPVP